MNSFKASNTQKVIFLMSFFIFWFFGLQVSAAPETCKSPPDFNFSPSCDVTIIYTDIGGGSGLAECLYRIKSAGVETVPWTSAGTCSGSGPVDLTVFISIDPGQDCRDSGTNACTIYSKARDMAGNESAEDSKSFNIDFIRPTTSIECNGTTCLTSWYNADVSIILSCSDDGSDCDKTYYCVDQTNSCSPGILYTSTFNLTTERTNYVRFYSIDVAGNAEATKSQTVKLDKTKPVSEITSPEAGSTQTGDFSVSVSDSDPLLPDNTTSGLDVCYYRTYDSAVGWTRNWTTRACNSSQIITISPTGDCQTIGGTCTVYVDAYDEAGNAGDIHLRSFNIAAVNNPPVSTIYRWDGSNYVDDPGDSWQKLDFTRYIYDYDSDGSLTSCEYYTYDNIAGGTTALGTRTPCTNGAFNLKGITVGGAKNCPSQGENACTLGVRSTDDGGATGEYDTATYHIDWEPPIVGETSPLTAEEGISQTYSALVSDNIELNYCWLYVDGVDKGSMAISPTLCRNGVSCTVSKEYTFPSGGIHTMYARCADHYDSQTGTYLNITSGNPVSVSVTANNPPVITAGPSYTTSPCTSPTTQTDCMVNFTVTATDVDGDPLTYSWIFGDGVISNEQNPSHHYSVANTYSVIVTVSDGRGGTASGGVTVTVIDLTFTLSVDLCAGLDASVSCSDPLYGTDPLSGLDLKAAVSGTMTGTINYKFDCTNDGVWELEVNNVSTNPYTATDLCDYPVSLAITDTFIDESKIASKENLVVSGGQVKLATLKADGEVCLSDSECESGYCYIDEDGDRYAPSSGTKKCQPSSQLTGTDCYDANADAYPGQTSYFGSNRGDGSFDYNCDSVETKQLDYPVTTYPTVGCYSGLGDRVLGWVSSVPDCGETQTRRTCMGWTEAGCMGTYQCGCSAWCEGQGGVYQLVQEVILTEKCR